MVLFVMKEPTLSTRITSAPKSLKIIPKCRKGQKNYTIERIMNKNDKTDHRKVLVPILPFQLL